MVKCVSVLFFHFKEDGFLACYAESVCQAFFDVLLLLQPLRHCGYHYVLSMSCMPTYDWIPKVFIISALMLTPTNLHVCSIINDLCMIKLKVLLKHLKVSIFYETHKQIEKHACH